MLHLPLYLDLRSAVEKAETLTDLNPKCTRCTLSSGARSVCLPADGANLNNSGDTLLVLGDIPTEAEDHARRPMSSRPNGMVRRFIEEHHDGPIVYASAIRCRRPPKVNGKDKKISDKTVNACRPYTKGLIEEIKPARIFCFGKLAYQIVLGSNPDPIQLGRRGYGYFANGTKVFMFPHASRVSPNRFLWKRLEEDMEWALTAKPEPPPWDGVIYQVENVEDSIEACRVMSATGGFTFDTETGGLMGDDEYFQVACLTATPYGNTEDAWLWDEDMIKDPAVLAPLQDLMRDAEVLKTGQNLKYDIEAVSYGFDLRDERGVSEFAGIGFDTLLALKALDTESMPKLSISDNLVGMGGHKADNAHALAAARELIGRSRDDPRQQRLRGMTPPALQAAIRHKNVKNVDAFAYPLIPREILYRYCALDTIATARLDALARPRIMGQQNFKLVREQLHNPATKAISQIEAWGMSADITAANLFGKMLIPVRDKNLVKIRENGYTDDITDGNTRKLLFETLKLPVQETTDTGLPAVNRTSLEKLEHKSPIVPFLMEHAKVTKLLSTYVDGLIPHIRPDGRVRSSINIAGTRSGRPSSSNPNLMNIPSRGSWAKMAKSIFNAPPGYVIVQLDYSQLEVRMAAILSQDPDLIQTYVDGVDVHRRTAARAFGVPESSVTKEQRNNAKAVVFGIMFGSTANTLSKKLGISLAKAREIFNLVLGVYEVLSKWMQVQRKQVERTGVCYTYLPDSNGVLNKARMRQLWQIAEPDSGLQSTARNGSVNTPIQGSASDFMMRTICTVVDWIIDSGSLARVTNTVYDSIIIEAPFAEALSTASKVKGIMEGWPSAGVPLVADIDIGRTWGSLMSLDGIKLVASSRKNGLSDLDILHVAAGDQDLADEMGKDPKGWLKKVDSLVIDLCA